MSDEEREVNLAILAPIPELDAWAAKAEARAKERFEALLATRLKCPTCGKVGVWMARGCVRPDGTPIPDGAYCYTHMGSAEARGEGFLSLNYHGWLPDGSTWTEGFPRWNEP